MNRTQILFIRAIKSQSAERRMKRLYKMFYCGQYDIRHIVSILNSIVEENSIMSGKDWIDGLNPDNSWQYGIGDGFNHYEKCVKVMSSFIRLASVSRFENFIKPAKFRREK